MHVRSADAAALDGDEDFSVAELGNRKLANLEERGAVRTAARAVADKVLMGYFLGASLVEVMQPAAVARLVPGVVSVEAHHRFPRGVQLLASRLPTHPINSVRAAFTPLDRAVRAGPLILNVIHVIIFPREALKRFPSFAVSASFCAQPRPFRLAARNLD